MTKQEWKEVESNMQPFGAARLKIDGYEISLAVHPVNKFKFAICIYVNGVIKGNYLTEDCEERRRFMRESKRCAYSGKHKKRMLKFGKKYLKEWGVDINKTYSIYFPWWNSFNSLKRHLVKNNKSIELVRDGHEMDE